MPVFRFYEEERRNITKSYVLIFLFTLVMGAFGFIIDYFFETGPWFTVIFLGIALIQILVATLAGPSVVLSSVRAQPLDESSLEHVQLQHIIQELSVAGNVVPPPKLYHIPGDQTINAFATGLRPSQAVICVTDGLLAALNREETQGVVAHELSHIENRDMLYMTLLSALIGAVVIVQMFALRAVIFVPSGGSKRDSNGGAIIIFLLAVAALATIFALFGRIVLFAVSRQREYLADAHAVELTRNPLGLSTALRKIAMLPGRVRTASVATAHLFISDPLHRAVNEQEGGFFTNLFATHPPLYSRIARLEGKGPQQVLRELQQAAPAPWTPAQ
jgi:heat shock protein HtpX